MPAHAVHRPRRGAAQAGFTLIELMVVIVMMAVITAVVVPNLAGTADTVRLDSAARRTADLMDFCRQAASSSGRTHALFFDNATRRFVIACEPTPTPAPGEEAATEAEAAPVATPVTTPAPVSTADATLLDGATDGATDLESDPAAAGTLVPVSIPGYADRTLPVGIALGGVETFESDLVGTGQEGQFRLLFFPDGTTEFARVELTTAAGHRRQVWLSGVGGTISIVDPERQGELTMDMLITDEDSAEILPAEETEEMGEEAVVDDGSSTPVQ